MEGEEHTGGVQNKYKIVLLGNPSVGKTCIIHRFMYDSFTENNEVLVF